MECPENMCTSSLKTNLDLAEYNTIVNKFICRDPFNRTLWVGSRRTFLNPICSFSRMDGVMQSTHQDIYWTQDVQQNHWAYRPSLRLRSRAAITVVNEHHHSTYHEACLCTSFSADRNNPFYQQLLSQFLSLCSTAGRNMSLPLTWWLRGDMPNHSSPSTGCSSLSLLCQLYVFLHRQFKQNVYKQVKADCISKSCILWQDSNSRFYAKTKTLNETLNDSM